jgi:putative ABC transport system permease protein
MGPAKISYLSLLFYWLLILIPVFIFLVLKIRLIKSMLIAFVRMVIQLAFVALYLEYIFKLNNFLINILWIFIMIIVANQAIIRQSGLKFRVFFLSTFPAYLLTIGFIFLTFFIILDVRTLFSARYIIPLGGMILGNTLRGNIVALDRFFHSLFTREDEYIYYLSMGASLKEALQPFIAESLKASIAPYIATIATLGLVSLPGMMTGQILGGASPLIAIQYQLMIMVAIFITATISTLLVIVFSLRKAIDKFGRLQEHIFIHPIR